MDHPQFHLLNKTELIIDGITLKSTNLNDISSVVAEVLSMDPTTVLVTDLRDNRVTLDILNPCVDSQALVGRKSVLLDRLSCLSGVTLSPDTAIHSTGVLGWINYEGEEARQALAQSVEMVKEIQENLQKRVMVFSTGPELSSKQIIDTNTPVITEQLVAEGYKVTNGDTLPDDKEKIAYSLMEAIEAGGYQLIITTGGVGAEDKDHTVEAVLLLDEKAATPYICHFQKGTGRHVKDGVKIAVGKHNGTLIIALPGPNDEVKASLGPMIHGLKTNADKQALAHGIASQLRHIWREKTVSHNHYDHG